MLQQFTIIIQVEYYLNDYLIFINQTYQLLMLLQRQHK